MVAQSDLGQLLVIVGETASGKSALAMMLAERFNGEIICADSWTVYKGFDVGTAKPTTSDQQRIPHHLLDVADPTAGFNAALFKRLAVQAIDDISGRHRLPILVGGTGLYIDSVLFDYSFLPAVNPDLRTELNKLNLTELLERVTADKLDTQGIDLRNQRRLIRLIENHGVRPSRQPLRDNTLVLGLQLSREELEQRIRQRIDKMIQAGLVEEVSTLGQKYGWDIEPFRAPGYRAFKDYVSGAISLEQARERAIRNDLQLAKKQRTWLRRNNSIQWIYEQGQSVDLVTTFLNK